MINSVNKANLKKLRRRKRMGKSEVYFSDFRANNGVPIPKKLQALVKRAGIDQIDLKDKYVAIKIHF